jgi:hypothetical protein
MVFAYLAGTDGRLIRGCVMQATTNEQVLAEVTVARQRAESVLKGLIEAQSECEKQLTHENRRDAMKLVTGKSSLENAVSTTRRMIESFDRQIQELVRTSGVAGTAGAPARALA